MYTKSNFLGNIFQYKLVSFPPKLKLISCSLILLKSKIRYFMFEYFVSYIFNNFQFFKLIDHNINCISDRYMVSKINTPT